MIIGRDLLENLGVIMDFKKSSVNWEGIEIPMRDFQRLKDLKMSHDEVNAIIKGSVEPLVTQEATERMVRILDSKYEKANLSNVVASTTHLTDVEKQKLFKLLVKYEDLFDGSVLWENGKQSQSTLNLSMMLSRIVNGITQYHTSTRRLLEKNSNDL